MPSIIKKSTYFTIHNGKFCSVKVGKKVKAMVVDNQRILKKNGNFLTILGFPDCFLISSDLD